MCWVILRERQIYTVIHSLIYIVAKCHFFSVFIWKYIIFTKMWGVYSLLWDTVCISGYNTHFKIVLYCILAAAIIKTHFECLRAFLLFLHPVAAVEQLWSIVLLNHLKHFRNKYVCKLHEVQQLPYGVWECSKWV